MRAAIINEVGTTPAFGDFNEPEGDDVADVLVAGLNPVDLYIARGMYGEMQVPAVAGLEGIARRAGGQKIYFNAPAAPFGSMAERVPVSQATTFEVPGELDDGVAVALGIAGLAAWLPLTFHAQLQRGESVLVLGASGVVGQIAVQAAKLLGAGRVVAAARSKDAIEGLGADATAVLGGDDAQALKDAAPDGYDIVIDPLYGKPLEAALTAAAPGARIVVIGGSAGFEATIPLPALYGRRIISHSNGAVPVEARREAFATMARHALAGEIAVDVERIPLAEVERAWGEQASAPHHKIVLVP